MEDRLLLFKAFAGIRRKLAVGLATLAMVSGLASPLHAAELPPVTLGWNANPEHDVTGYELRYGTTPGWHPIRVSTGSNTVTVSGLQEGTTYYFVVVARDRAGNTSTHSKQISYRVDARVTKAPQSKIIDPAKTVTITAGSTLDFSGEGTDPNGRAPFTYQWKFGTGSGLPDSFSKTPGALRFDTPGTYFVTFAVTNSHGTVDPTPARRTVVVKEPATRLISRKGWKLKWVNSEDAANYPARFAFDDDPATFWHTEWGKPDLPPPPHEIQIDLGKVRPLAGFQYLPRQDGFSVGNVGNYQFYVSKDGKKWGKPVATGAFHNTPELKKIFFPLKKGRYVRLVSMAEVNGYRDCNVAELHVLEAKIKKKKKKSAVLAAAATLAKNLSSAASAVSSIAPAPTAPGVSATSTATLILDGKKYRSLTVLKSSLPAGMVPVVEVSGNLLEWSSGRNHTTVLLDTGELLKVRDNLPFSPASKRHIRLKPDPR